MKAVIFSNGEFNPESWNKEIIDGAELIIAADGGARHAIRMGLNVQHLIGDMDSIGLEDFNVLKSSQCRISIFPEDKIKTDLELAMDLAVQSGANEIHILAAEGGRFDHIIGNALISANTTYANTSIWFYSKNQRVTALHASKLHKIATKSGAILSVIPLCTKICSFSISGVQWPLDCVELNLGSTFTISNRTASDLVQVSFENGVVLLVIEDISEFYQNV